MSERAVGGRAAGERAAAASARLPLGYIGAAYLESAPKLLGGVLAGAVYLFAPDVWPGPWAWLALAPLLAVLVCEPPWRWWSTRVTLTAQHLTIATGMWHRREQSLAWSDVGAVDTRQPWAFRFWGLRSLTLAQAGDERTKVQLWAVDEETHARIVALAGHRAEDRPAHAERVAHIPDAAPDAAGTVIYRVRLSHLVLASLVYGQFAVIGGAAAAAAWEFLGSVGAADLIVQWIPLPPVMWGVVIAVAIVVMGFALTVIRYAGFEVRRTADGRLVISYGLLSTHTRSIAPAAVVGVILQRNLVETVLGRARLALLTTDSAAQLGANLVLPSLPRTVVTHLLRTAFDDQVGPRLLTTSRGYGAMIRGAALLVALAASAAGILWVTAEQGWPPLASASAALLCLAVLWRLTALLCSRLSVSEDARRVLLTSTHVVQRQSVLVPASVHVVAGTRVLGRNVFVQVFYYAGMPRALRAMRFDRADVDGLSARVAQTRPLAATHRRRPAARPDATARPAT